MNWFERYGIAGAYTVGLIMLNLETFDHLPTNELTILVAAGALFFLPIGYIVSVFAQWLIYRNRTRRVQVHLSVLEFLTGQNPKIRDEIDFNTATELQAETWLAMKYRETVDEQMEKRRQIIMEWARKRWDVLAINFTLMVVSVASFIVSSLHLCYLKKFSEYPQYLSATKFTMYTSAEIIIPVIFVILMISRDHLRRQLIDAYRIYFPSYFRELETFKSKKKVAIDRSHLGWHIYRPK